MSTDRELLELAAKAAGIKVLLPVMSEGMTQVAILESSLVNTVPTFWQPLTDDGDALRLAVKLGMTLNIDTEMQTAVALGGWLDGEFHPTMASGTESFGDDPYAATRRAIVRAAAAIGATK